MMTMVTALKHSVLAIIFKFLVLALSTSPFLPQSDALQLVAKLPSPKVSAHRLPKSPCDNVQSRRSLLSGTGRGVAAAGISTFILTLPADPALADPMQALVPGGGAARIEPLLRVGGDWKTPSLSTKLGTSRIATNSLTPLQQGPFASQELYYPPFLFGTWKVTATLKQKVYPFGKEFVPSTSLIEGSPRNREEQVGDTTTYEVQYFSTKESVQAGVPPSKIIADRSFNTISMSRAYDQLTPVEVVEWDYRADPTRLTLRFGAAPLAEDMRPLGRRRGEVYLTARQSESLPNTNSNDLSAYCAAERSRSITVGPGVVFASDMESITEFQKLDDDTVRAVSRIAVYLTPNPNSREGVLWQQVGGKAVAFFDYELEMTKIKKEIVDETDGSKMMRSCVETPKGILQCY